MILINIYVHAYIHIYIYIYIRYTYTYVCECAGWDRQNYKNFMRWKSSKKKNFNKNKKERIYNIFDQIYFKLKN